MRQHITTHSPLTHCPKRGLSWHRAGRLTTATQCPQTQANLSAHKSSNRTSQTIAGASTTYCYDQADRLISSSNPNYTSAQYDAHGNTRFLGQETTTSAKTEFTYDSSDRLRQLTQTQTGQPTKAHFYNYDVANRLKYRTVQHNWSTQSTQHYGYTGSGDTPDFLRDNAWTITEKYLSLPGDVLLTIRPGATAPADKTYSLTNLHGDTMATTSATGTVLSTHLTGPFGEKLSTYPTIPNNASVNGATFQYVGAHEKLTESDLTITPIHMGARTYLPQLGRFAQVDPVQGGTPNSYVYPTDPVNDFDLTGMWSWNNVKANTSAFFKGVGETATKHQDTIKNTLSVVGIAACVVGTGGLCLGVAVAAAGISGLMAGSSHYAKSGNARQALFTGIRTGAKDFLIDRIGGRIAGARHVVRHFGKVGRVARHYRSFSRAVTKKPARTRAIRQVGAGITAWTIGNYW